MRHFNCGALLVGFERRILYSLRERLGTNRWTSLCLPKGL